ncbi:Queuine/other tRNA-ribosyltransferase [Methanothermus fervidus DSM 2088]|uniref:Queuine/other tRNA-ribosyltransferase n=1 Tax=Methanothermus fervidus (strain ATCC 43054 / DSM 2088 / JCM 10308 / V24 S) TaxID=523846 RepID=E3GYX1_METFV|nr:queuine/other tRNA-ribosyltransferase [Methanothermus fervidus]ADP77503.1 Queuine/other tRNA-ribosyltransferase [Methanothermus fervidus DSM 2088]
MIEIIAHDGPARLGKIDGKETPLIIPQEYIDPIFLPLPYDVPRELAEWAVEYTIDKYKSYEGEFAIITGGKYIDLRVKCATKLEELGFTNLVISNGTELLKRPKDLVNLIVKLRKNLKPTTSLSFTFPEPLFIPLLVYMGVDIFPDGICKYYAEFNVLMTPTKSYSLDTYKIYDFDKKELLEYNKKTLDYVIREVKSHIRNGTLRNLVEERAAALPECMSALRILDKEYSDYLQEFTLLY